MSTYKLFYFNAKGRAETSRFIFAQAGVKYEDVRFTGEQWASEYKAKSPSGSSPWLEVDGKPVSGSLVIARYLGETFGLAGKNDVENAQLASIVDTYNDCATVAMKAVFEKDDKTKADLKEAFLKECPKWFDNFEKRINSNGNGWIFGSTLTWADIVIATGLNFILVTYPNALDAYPYLKALKAKVEAQPKIAEWIKTRPETNM